MQYFQQLVRQISHFFQELKGGDTPNILNKFGGHKMKKSGISRYDLDRVYHLREYKNVVAYGQKNSSIKGVQEQLQSLDQEKSAYCKNVADVTTSERDTEQAKYHQYEKWMKLERKCKWAVIGFILVLIVCAAFEKYFPIALRTSLIYALFGVLLMLSAFLVGPIIFIAAKIVRHSYGVRYSQYIGAIAAKLDSLGDGFAKKSLTYYDTIDNLYLLSLDTTHRELILLRRQQELHNQDMLRLEKERQRTEDERFKEQQRARQATEKLLAIETEREKRYRGW